MNEDSKKPVDQREGEDRRQDDNADYEGQERRVEDRRKDKPAPK